MGLKNSNLYVEKIYAEHPLGLWALDDDVSYAQTTDQATQDFSGIMWNLTNATALPPNDYSDAPIDRLQTLVQMSSGSGIVLASIESTFGFLSTNYDQSLGSLCISSNVRHISSSIFSYEIGMLVGAVETSTTFAAKSGWQCLTHTVDLPPTAETISFFIRIHSYTGGGQAQFDGMSIGQWSEPYAAVSNGYIPSALPAEIDNLLSSSWLYNGVALDAYGVDVDNTGYFPSVDGRVFVRPAGIPLVFGSNNSLSVLPTPHGNPSIMVPGNGFLNDAGKYGMYTLEAWIRLYSEALDPVRIIGPVASTDGIYLEEGFISLYVGPYTKSYFVGKFARPMLLHMTYSDSRVGLMINGEQVISIDIDTSNITFPASHLGGGYGTSQDWIGVYGNTYVSPFEIDCLAIFPYLMPPEVAKKHFIYGQAVQEPDFSNDKFVRRTVQFDFPYAEYAYNVIYPDTTRWRSGFSVNMDASSTSLKASTHKLPQILIEDNVTDDEWFVANLAENTAAGDLFAYLKINPQNIAPNGGSLYFDSLNVLDDKVVSVAGTFKLPPSAGGDEVLLSFTNKVTGEKIAVRLVGGNLLYDYFDPNTVSTNLYTEPVTYNEYITAGIHIPGLSASFNSTIGNFFSSHDRISVKVGGDVYGTFSGNIYNLHFTNKYFYEKDLSTFFSNGIIVQEAGYSSLFNYVGNYSMLPTMKNATMGIDIGASGYWEDLLPLSMFGKTVTASAGTAYDLDMIQFNIDAPYSNTYGSGFVPTYTYTDMMAFYELYDNDYAYLSTLGATYQDIIDYMNANASDLRYSTGFGSYITFQKFDDVGNNLYSGYTNIVSASANRVISPQLSEFANTKYEIYDDCIILIPDDIDFTEYYLGVHLDIRIRGVNDKNVTVKRLELASYASNDNSVVTRLGTKYSIPIYPFAVAS